jgi:hypothetical protein
VKRIFIFLMDARVKPAHDELSARRKMVGFAEFIIGRAFARPVGSTHESADRLTS